MLNRGFITWIVLIIIALALLKYFFDWSIFDFISSEKGRETVEYVKSVILTVWSYIRVPVAFLWERILELFNLR